MSKETKECKHGLTACANCGLPPFSSPDLKENEDKEIFADLQEIALKWCNDKERNNYIMEYIRRSVTFRLLIVQFQEYIIKHLSHARTQALQEGIDKLEEMEAFESENSNTQAVQALQFAISALKALMK